MKYFTILVLVAGLGYCSASHADECKTTKVTIERNGKVESETATICKEGDPIDTKVHVGDTILESEVSKTNLDKYFTYHNTKCRIFSEHTVLNKELRDYYGVICQINNGDNWIVVDKW